MRSRTVREPNAATPSRAEPTDLCPCTGRADKSPSSCDTPWPQANSRQSEQSFRRGPVARRGADYIGTMPVQEKHRFDEQTLAALHGRARRGLHRAGHGRAVQGRPVQPDLPPDRRRRPALRAAPQAARQAAAVGACGRPRVPRDFRVEQDRRADAQGLCAVRGRQRGRNGLLHHGILRRPRAVGSAAARGAEGGPARDLPGEVRRAGPPASRSTTPTSASPTSAGPAATSRARSRAGASSTRRRRPRPSRRWTSCSTGCPRTCRQNDETVLVHGDYRLDNMVYHAERAARAGRDRLGDLHPGRSAGRALLSLHAVAHAQGLGRPAGPRSRGARPADRAGDGALLLRPVETRRARRRRSGNSTWPTISSASRASARASMPARSTARRPTSRAAESGKLVRPAAELAWQIVDRLAGAAR